MASLLRPSQLGLLQRCAINHLVRSRNISTSKKNSETCSTTATAQTTKPEEQNWVSYGFDRTNKEADTNWHNATFFFTITLCMVFGGFMWAYAPDFNLRNWAQREGFLELRRREKAGLPPISPHFIDPKTIALPSDEELEGVEIVI